jgi:hypothetical protein
LGFCTCLAGSVPASERCGWRSRRCTSLCVPRRSRRSAAAPCRFPRRAGRATGARCGGLPGPGGARCAGGSGGAGRTQAAGGGRAGGGGRARGQLDRMLDARGDADHGGAAGGEPPRRQRQSG